MDTPPGYEVQAIVRQDPMADFYRGVRAVDARRVVIEVPRQRPPSQREVARLRHAFALGSELDSAALVRAVAVETWDDRVALISEDAGGSFLDEILGASLEIGEALSLAIGIAQALVELHRWNVIHKDIRPESLLVHPKTRSVQLTNLGHAVRGVSEPSPPFASPPHPWSLPYLSPEQTGRVGRLVDARTDLYSVGVVVYRLLTGALPFRADEPLEWIHSHLARPPPPPSLRCPAVPEALSDLVMRLLSKAPEERYQTAAGLLADLQHCEAQWSSVRRIDPFPLGVADTRGEIATPRVFHGRTRELESLRAALERVADARVPELLLVKGEPGVGKSSLVRRFAASMSADGDLFLAGKFDPRQRGVPYVGFARALSPLFRRLAAEAAPRRALWRERLRSVIGASGWVVADLIPELLLVTGELPEVATLSPTEAHDRFLVVFRRLLGALGDDGPVTLFLDDLQWADPASIRMLQHLFLTDSLLPFPLLVLGAYRDREVGPSEPLIEALDEIKKAGARVTEIALPPLSREDLVPLVAEALGLADDDEAKASARLAALVHDKSRGNPFFALQLLSALHRKGLVVFDRGRAAWRWDDFGIRTLSVSDDVVDLVIERLQRLPPAPREALTFAACLGSPVEMEALSVASDLPEETLRASLEAAVHEGLMLPHNESYRFLHDRVQQAAYALLSPEERADTHLRIGRRLLAHTPPQALAERVFTLVGQLNLGVDRGEPPGQEATEERVAVAQLNLLAARRAKAASAYRGAIDYLEAGLALLPADPWGEYPLLARAFHRERAECALLTGDLDHAQRLIDVLLQQARTHAERADAYRVAIDLHTTRGALRPAIESAIACLAQYGIELAPAPTAEQIAAAEEEVSTLLGERPLESLPLLAPMRDADIEAAMSVLGAFLPTSYFSDVRLHHLVACQMVILTLRHGLVPASAMGLAAYAFELAMTHEDHAKALRVGRLALSLVERHGFVAYEAKVCNLLGATTLVWMESLRAVFASLEQGARAGQRSGDLIFASLNLTHRYALAFAAGEPLEEVERRIEAAAAAARSIRYDPLVLTAEVFRRSSRALRGPPVAHPPDEVDETSFAARVEASPPRFVACWYHLMRLQIHLVFGDNRGALDEAQKTSGLILHLRGQHAEAEFLFAEALALSTNWEAASPEVQTEWLAKLDDRLDSLRRHAAVCPANFRSYEALVSGEIARLRGGTEQAMARYEDAIRFAREDGFVHRAALASEIAARFYLARGFPVIANAYLEQALHAYRQWGAEAKVHQLERLYPGLRPREPRTSIDRPFVESGQLDVQALVRASQAVSREILVPRLLEALMRSTLEEAGAERGALMTLEEGRLFVRAAARIDATGTSVTLFAEPAAPGADLPASVLSHVQQTRRPLLLDDATQPGPFSADFSDPPKVGREKLNHEGAEGDLSPRRVRSVLCAPIVHQDDLLGLLYLENNQLAGAFTPERTITLEVLASQAAISLENARLYQAAKGAIEVRDDFLMVAAHELRTPITSMQLQVQSLAKLLGSGAAGASGTRDARTGERLVNLLGVFEREVGRLAHLAEQMLDVSQLEAGALSLSLETCDLGALVREGVTALKERLTSARCAVELDIGAQVIGNWDRARIKRVVADILANALKFGGGSPITVRVGSTGDRAHLEVQDRGGGIAGVDQLRIFERFEQAVSVLHYGGLGLGLYLARETVRAHGGSISVESTPGAGATFVVELPLSRAARPE